MTTPTADTWVAYTDGACKGNPGPGGWGVRIKAPDASGGATTEYHGGEAGTTNNRMELFALHEALRATPAGASVLLHTDSEYAIKCCSVWRGGWERKDMRKADGKPVANPDLLRALWALLDARKVQFQWVRGHNGDPGNERADELANMGVANPAGARVTPSAAPAAVPAQPKPQPAAAPNPAAARPAPATTAPASRSAAVPSVATASGGIPGGAAERRVLKKEMRSAWLGADGALVEGRTYPDEDGARLALQAAHSLTVAQAAAKGWQLVRVLQTVELLG